MLEIKVSPRWRASFPGGQVGLLLIGDVDNTSRSSLLDEYKRRLEADLRKQYSGLSRAELLELPVLQAYKDYYRTFNKTYHVQLQLESVVFKDKRLPSVSPLVEAVFAAELETLILTAGHDADQLVSPVTIDASQGDETYQLLNGEIKDPKPGDMLMRDGLGAVCTIIYGQDRRTPITPDTRRALYVAYVPPGIDPGRVEHHLDRIEANVRLFATEAEVGYRSVFRAGN